MKFLLRNTCKVATVLAFLYCLSMVEPNWLSQIRLFYHLFNLFSMFVYAIGLTSLGTNYKTGIYLLTFWAFLHVVAYSIYAVQITINGSTPTVSFVIYYGGLFIGIFMWICLSFYIYFGIPENAEIADVVTIRDEPLPRYEQKDPQSPPEYFYTTESTCSIATSSTEEPTKTQPRFIPV
jgi:hypothetical protein